MSLIIFLEFSAFICCIYASIDSDNHVARSMYLFRYVQGAQIWASQGLAQSNQVVPQSFPLGETIIRDIGSWVWGWEQLLPSFLHLNTWDIRVTLFCNLTINLLPGLISFLHLQAHNYELPEEKLCLSFLSNNNTGEDGTVIFRGEKYYVPSRSVSILADCKNVVYNTKRVRVLHAVKCKLVRTYLQWW